MAFQGGTDRGGFKAALLNAFQSAHNNARFGTGGRNPVRTPAGMNNDERGNTLLKGGMQAAKTKAGYMGGHAEDVLGGGSHSSPAAVARGPVNHNNDPRSTGLMTDGHQANRVPLTAGSATNAHVLEPNGRPQNAIKLPRNQNNDARALRKGSGV